MDSKEILWNSGSYRTAINQLTLAELAKLLRQIDMDFVPPLHEQCVLAAYAEKIHQYGTTFEIYHADRLIAFCAGYFNDRETWAAFITLVHIAPDFRSKGLGRAIIRMALQYADSQKMKSISLTVSAKNEKALRLYSRSGFTPLPSEGNTSDRLLMTKTLSEK